MNKKKLKKINPLRRIKIKLKQKYKQIKQTKTFIKMRNIFIIVSFYLKIILTVALYSTMFLLVLNLLLNIPLTYINFLSCVAGYFLIEDAKPWIKNLVVFK